MKEYPTVFVVQNADFEIENAFYERSEAVKYCKEMMVQYIKSDPKEWLEYFKIWEVHVK